MNDECRSWTSKMCLPNHLKHTCMNNYKHMIKSSCAVIVRRQDLHLLFTLCDLVGFGDSKSRHLCSQSHFSLQSGTHTISAKGTTKRITTSCARGGVANIVQILLVCVIAFERGASACVGWGPGRQAGVPAMVRLSQVTTNRRLESAPLFRGCEHPLLRFGSSTAETGGVLHQSV